MSQTDRETPRSIAIVGLIMLLLVVLGYVALGIVMKLNGYPNEQLGIKWTPLAVTLRQHGHWSLALPLVWFICAIAAERVNRGIVCVSLATGVGGILMGIIFFLFLWAVANPFTRSLLIAIPEEKSPNTESTAEPSPDARQSR